MPFSFVGSGSEVVQHVSQRGLLWDCLYVFILEKLGQHQFVLGRIVLLVVLEAERPLDLLVAAAGIAYFDSALIGMRSTVLCSCDCGVDGRGKLPFGLGSRPDFLLIGEDKCFPSDVVLHLPEYDCKVGRVAGLLLEVLE